MKSKSNRENAELGKFWKTHIKTWKNSGLSQAEYCRRNDLKKTRFTYWKLKFDKQYLPQAFVEVSQATVKKAIESKAINPLMIHCSSGFTVEVPQSFSSESLKQILTVLKEV
jgi:hypothetical protein